MLEHLFELLTYINHFNFPLYMSRYGFCVQPHSNPETFETFPLLKVLNIV